MPSIKAVYIPPPAFKEAEYKRVVRNALRRATYRLKKDFEATTETWDHEVVFKEHTHLAEKDPIMSASITTDDQIYAWVNDGTGLKGPGHAKYPIYPGAVTGKSDKTALAFPSVSRPKTRPGYIGSGLGYRGGKTRFAKAVWHPGIKARLFTEAIKRKWEPWFKREMIAAIRLGNKLSGHEWK